MHVELARGLLGHPLQFQLELDRVGVGRGVELRQAVDDARSAAARALRNQASTTATGTRSPERQEDTPVATEVITVSTAAAPPSPTIIAQVEALGAEIIHVYGLTEVYGPYTVCEWQPQWNLLPAEERARVKARQGVGYLIADDVPIGITRNRVLHIATTARLLRMRFDVATNLIEPRRGKR